MSVVMLLLIGIGVGYVAAVWRNPLCAWEAIRDSLKTGALVVGHSYVERERVTHCVIDTAQCERCGKWNVGWQRTAGSVSEDRS